MAFIKHILKKEGVRFKITLFIIGLAVTIVAMLGINGYAQKSHGSVPKLHIFRDCVDYKNAIARETLAPDHIIVHNGRIDTGMSEKEIIDILGAEYKIIEKYNYRTKKQQREFLNLLLSSNDNSMHYYILAHVFYDLQLQGWFKIYEWQICDVRIWAFLVLQLKCFKIGPPFVWLFHVTMTPTEENNVKYLKADSLILVRHGQCDIIWNASSNTLQIIDTTKAP
jgi:hypothetical protein